MNAIRALILMLLIISIISGSDFSMNSFIEYIQDNGGYNLLQEVKYYLGDDIAISVCKEIFQSNYNCETLVILYLTNSASGKNILRNLEDLDIGEIQNDEDEEQVENFLDNEEIIGIFQSIEEDIEEMNLEPEVEETIVILLDIFKGYIDTFINVLQNSNDIDKVTWKIIYQII